MNFFVHMASVVVIDYLIFLYWYALANRYDVLNFHETGFLPARYIMSGLVAGAFLYWVYLIPVVMRKRFSRRYQHPRWWLLWVTVGMITSLQIANITVKQGSPPLDIEVAIALIVHLQLIHLMMFLMADLSMKDPVRIVIPGIRPGVAFMAMWLFWLWYSFAVKSEGRVVPRIGEEWERYVIGMVLIILIWLALIYLWGLNLPRLRHNTVLIEPFNITVMELLKGFYSAWALFFLTIPMVHYFVRGYVTAHSNIFPSFLAGFFVPVVWSLIVMWPLIWLMRPEMINWREIRLPRALFQNHQQKN